MKNMFDCKRVMYVKRLLEYSTDKNKISLIIFLRVLAIVLSLFPPFFYNLFIDNVLTRKQINFFAIVIIGYLGVYLAQMLNSIISTKIYTKFLIDITRNIKKKLLEKFWSMKINQYNSNSVGEKKNIIENDIDVVDGLIENHFLNYYYQFVYAIILFIIMFCINWKLTLISMVMIPLSFKFAKMMSKKAKEVSAEHRKQLGDYEGFVWGGLNNYKEIKSNCLEDKMVAIFYDHWKRLGDLFVKQQMLWFANRTFVSFKDFFIVNMNLYFIGGVMIINGSLGLTTLLIFMNYYASFFNAISIVMDSKVQVSSQEIKMDRIIQILDYKPETYNHVDIVNNAISLNNISFSYEMGKETVLKDISLEIKEKQKVAFVGKSGCGKTSLINLIYRLYEPQNGTIKIGGNDINLIDPDEYGRMISVVLQNPCFFDNSIRYNLQLANKNATDDRLYEVLEYVGLKDFVLKCTDKLDTVIGENGIKLSGGQRQRLALCRALLKDTDIIILDEATSALDSKNESEIMNVLNKIGREKTIISVSHRLSTVYKSDVIYVMDEGRTIAQGKHDELKNSCKLYCDLFGKQFKEVESIAVL